MNVLFIGDSVTAGGRDVSDPTDLGHGYVSLMSKMISNAFPDRSFSFYNTGVPGNRAEQVVDRLETDMVALAPKVTVLLIGVNDAWCRFYSERILTDSEFETSVRTILDTARSLGSSVVMLEPYLFPDEKHFVAFEELDGKIRVLRRLAREYADAYVALHGAFSEEIVKREWTDFSSDGVHPNEEGVRFIAEKGIAAVTSVIAKRLAE